MKRKVLLLLVFSFLVTGVVAGASKWGSYKGNSIVQVKIDGGVFKPAGVPAISYNGQTMLPISVLDKAGVKYNYDKKTLSVNVQKLTSVRSAAKTLNRVYFQNLDNGLLQVSTYVDQVKDENSDWDLIFGKAMELSKLDADVVAVDYYKPDGVTWIGAVSIDRKHLADYKNGKIADAQLAGLWSVQGNMYRQTLSAKEIGKLADRVGFVEILNDSGQVIGSGSGFMISEGVFVTNSHVGSAGSLRIKLDGTTYETQNYYLFDNSTTDVFGVILSTSYDPNGRAIGYNPTKMLDYTTDLPEIGDKVYAIGSPRGLENTLSEGIVSSIRTIDGVTWIQHTADIDHGSSGGALLNEFGQVIGITSSGVEGSNLEFAVPMKYVIEEYNRS